MTFSKLLWLKRTDGCKFTGAEFRVLVSIFNHSDERGQKSHPGNKLMMEETGYGKAAVSQAVTTLKSHGWIRESYRGNGISGRSSVYELVADAPNPPHSSPTDELCSSPPVDLCRSHSSHGANHSSPPVVPIVRLDWSPTDPLTDPERSDPVRGSDPREVRESPNHQGDLVETDARSLAATEKMSESFTADELEQILSEVETEGGLAPSFGQVVAIVTPPEVVNSIVTAPTPWPRDKPLPLDVFAVYADDETGEEFAYGPGKLPTPKIS